MKHLDRCQGWVEAERCPGCLVEEKVTVIPEFRVMDTREKDGRRLNWFCGSYESREAAEKAVQLWKQFQAIGSDAWIEQRIEQRTVYQTEWKA